jgi:hypothetical protein
MNITVKVTSVNLKFINSKSVKLRRVNRNSLYFLIYLAQRKFRDGNVNTKTEPDLHKYNATLKFSCSLSKWLALRLKGAESEIVITSYNKIIRNFFYEDFFEYMNKRMLAKHILSLQNEQVKQYAEAYMEKLSLSDDDISLETLLRNYRRYRENEAIDLYLLIESLADE